MNSPGGNEPLYWVVPAHQSLETVYLAGLSDRMGLVVNSELLAFNGPTQLSFHLQSPLAFASFRWLKMT